MSAINKSELYWELYSAYSKAHSEKKSKKVIQDNVNNTWTKIKNDPDLFNLVRSEIKSLNQVVSIRQVSILACWNKANERKQTVTNESHNINVNSTVSTESNAPSTDEKENFVLPLVPIESTSDEIKECDVILSKENSTPVQDKLKMEHFVLSCDIEALEKRKNLDLLSDDNTKELRLKKKRLLECHKQIKKKQSEMIRQREMRRKKKNILAKACEDDPNLKRRLKVRQSVGGPRIELDQPLLLSAIIDLALQGSAETSR